MRPICHGVAGLDRLATNILMLMRGAIAARSLGVFERYVDEMYRHMWAEPKKLGSASKGWGLCSQFSFLHLEIWIPATKSGR